MKQQLRDAFDNISFTIYIRTKYFFVFRERFEDGNYCQLSTRSSMNNNSKFVGW